MLPGGLILGAERDTVHGPLRARIAVVAWLAKTFPKESKIISAAVGGCAHSYAARSLCIVRPPFFRFFVRRLLSGSNFFVFSSHGREIYILILLYLL